MTKTRQQRVNLYPTEDIEQIKLSAWLTRQGIRHNASAAGAKRSLAHAMKLKSMGMSAGFPDIEIPIPAGNYHGCYIEMKRIKGGKPSPAQIDWLDFLRNHGYYAELCHGFEEAKETVTRYLALTKPAA